MKTGRNRDTIHMAKYGGGNPTQRLRRLQGPSGEDAGRKQVMGAVGGGARGSGLERSVAV